MYGLVNKAIQGLVTQEHGFDTWEEVLECAGLDIAGFVGMEAYEDDITYRLVDAASKVLSTPADEILEAFGVYWTKYIADQGYGDLLNISGDNLAEFLGNLDALHTRVAATFPNLSPPHFETRPYDGGLILEYHSQREGLAPMVVGLIHGMAARFGQRVRVSHEGLRKDAGHDSFRIEFL